MDISSIGCYPFTVLSAVGNKFLQWRLTLSITHVYLPKTIMPLLCVYMLSWFFYNQLKVRFMRTRLQTLPCIFSPRSLWLVHLNQSRNENSEVWSFLPRHQTRGIIQGWPTANHGALMKLLCYWNAHSHKSVQEWEFMGDLATPEPNYPSIQRCHVTISTYTTIKLFGNSTNKKEQ